MRLVTLGDGAERGVRLLEVRSGGGLEVEIVVDRGFDLGRLALDGVTMSWHSPTGLRAPWLFDAFDDDGQGFLRGFSGLLATCGHDHIRQPETDPDGRRHPLHGRGANEPARLLACGREGDVLVAVGEVVQATALGPAIRRRRRVSVPVGGTGLEIEDVVENVGWGPVPLAMLYHVNLAGPLAGDRARIEAPGARLAWTDAPHDPFGPWVPEGEPRRSLSGHHVPDQACARIAAHGVSLELSWDGRAMPCLQLLRHEGEGPNWIALEPCTTHHRTRRAAIEAGAQRHLAPGDAETFRMALSLSRGAPWLAGRLRSDAEPTPGDRRCA